MITRHSPIRSLLAICLASVLVGIAHGQTTLNYQGGYHTENFTARGPGWHGYYSLRNTIYNGAADGEWRRMGDLSQLSLGDGLGTRETLANDICFALVLQNTSTNHYHCFAIGFYGEQWRITSGIPRAFSLKFDWGVFSTFTTEQPNGVANPSTIVPHGAGAPGGFTTGYSGASSEMHIEAFIQHTTAQPLDGNRSANRRRRLAVVDRVNWMPGQYLVLRWFADYDVSVGAEALAVDDLWFRAAREGDIDFLAADLTPAREAQFTACGFASAEHELQHSTDLRNWTRVEGLSSDSGKLPFTVNVNEPRRFFRLLKP